MKIRLKYYSKQKGEMHVKVLRYRQAWCVLGIVKEDQCDWNGVSKGRDRRKWAIGIGMGQDHMKTRENLRMSA